MSHQRSALDGNQPLHRKHNRRENRLVAARLTRPTRLSLTDRNPTRHSSADRNRHHRLRPINQLQKEPHQSDTTLVHLASVLETTSVASCLHDFLKNHSSLDTVSAT